MCVNGEKKSKALLVLNEWLNGEKEEKKEAKEDCCLMSDCTLCKYKLVMKN